MPGSGNLLLNPGFDGSPVTGWELGNATVDASSDVDGCSGSSAVQEGFGAGPRQCVAMQAGKYFYYGARIKNTAPGNLSIQFFDTTDCSGSSFDSASVSIQSSDAWQNVQGDGSTSAGTKGVMFTPGVTYGYWDQAYLSLTANSF
jgi:hypothetical protein